ncbi:MAG TPA: hypothetical protein VGO34_11265 [Alphaproteobacteria bacterium]
MILTPIAPEDLPRLLALFGGGLPVSDAVARAAFARIAGAPRDLLTGAAEEAARLQAVALAARFGIATLEEEPAKAFSWDGQAVRALSEPAVLLHEIAHWQICPPARRELYDFGLGAGPETGRRDDAESARLADQATQEREEAMASLLGILWETELGQPAVLAFAEQNWLEAADRPGTPAYFATVIGWLHDAGLIDDDARPRMATARAEGCAA